LVISLVIQAFYSVQFTKLTKELEYKKLAIYQFIGIIVGTLIGLIAAYNNFGVWSLVIQTLSTEITKVLIAWTMIFWKPKFVFQKNKFDKHFTFGYKMAASGLLNTIFNEIYTFVIGKYYSVANLGYYSRALSLSQYPSNTLSVIVHKVSFPMLSAIQNDDVKLIKMQKTIIQLILFVIAPILIIMGILATPLFKVIYTEKWLPAVPIFQLLLINALLYPIHAFNLQIVGIKGRSDLFLKAEVYKKIIIAISIAVAIFIGGLYSVIIASIFASLFSLLVNVYFSNKVLNFGYWEQIKNIFPTLIYGALMALVTMLLYKLFQQMEYSDLVNIVCVSFVSLIFYFGIAYFIRLEPMKEVMRILGRRNV
jgi:O-antigen/teichoic acid export membrane protein